jgi:hypothetical protein
LLFPERDGEIRSLACEDYVAFFAPDLPELDALLLAHAV